MVEKNIQLDSTGLLRDIFGTGDKNLHALEKEFDVRISLTPGGISLRGDKTKIDYAAAFLRKVIRLAQEGISFTQQELDEYIAKDLRDRQAPEAGIKVSSGLKKIVIPKTEGQEGYLEAIKKYDIAFCIGPAGTGKTYLAMAMAVNYLMERKVRRIILTRPAIEAGESLGFLPGDMQQKLGPYLRPLYDALYDMMDAQVIETYLETGVIEVAPLAYMRGRTLNNAFVVLDEAQNCTTDQLKMFLTRLGFDSKAVITGDITQSDLPGGKPTGLIAALKILKPIKGIKFINLTKKDVVRHPLIQKIIQAYEDFYRQEGF